MKFMFSIWILCAAMVLTGDDFVFPRDAALEVKYQKRALNGGSWATGSMVLRGIANEDMARNQIAAKYRDAEVRILGVKHKVARNFQVTYQYRNARGGAWATGVIILQDALTGSMAANQLSSKYSNYEIRILSMIEK